METITRIEAEKTVPRFTSRHHALWWMSQWYYPSLHWRTLSRETRRRHPYCQRCKFRRSVQTHHLSYEHLWDERPSELLAVCLSCHSALEDAKKRTRRAKRRGRFS